MIDVPAASPAGSPPAGVAGRNIEAWMCWTSRLDVRLGLLLLLCLVPRTLVAWKSAADCDDAYYYVHIADALERGHLDRALEYLNLNVYPVILMELHRLGIEWFVAGRLWSVVMGTALVLPLFDWLRRMFDARTATWAAFLYAVHPKMIEYAAEPTREATFWFLFVLSLDIFWICVEKRRVWPFALAGLALALALHTRFEGWLLLAPLAVWSAACWVRDGSARLRLGAGLLICVAVTPLVVLLANVTLLANHPRWELGRLSPIVLVENLLPASVARALPRPPDASALPAAIAKASPISSTGAARTVELTSDVAVMHHLSRSGLYLFELTRSIGIVYLVFCALGAAASWRQLRDPNRSVLWLLAGAVLLGIWIRLAQLGNTNGRYFLIVVLLVAPFAAAGMLVAARQLERLRPGRTGAGRRSLSAAVPVCVLLAGCIQAFAAHHHHRAWEAGLGRWAADQCGTFESAIADFQSIRPAYFAAGKMPDVVTYDEFLDKKYDLRPPDLFVVHPPAFRPDLLVHLLQRATDLGLSPLDQSSFAASKPEYIVLVRNQNRVAQLPRATGVQ